MLHTLGAIRISRPNIFISNRISNIKKPLNDTATLIMNSTYIETPYTNTNTGEENETTSDINLQIDPTNLSRQTSMAGTHSSIMIPLSPGMEENVEEDDWMDILHWIANPYMTADLGTKSMQYNQERAFPPMITADQISPESEFYNGEPWLTNISELIPQGNLKSARTIKGENKSLDTEDLED